MRTVSMVEFRRDAEAVIRKAQQGKRMIVTYRGEPVLRLEPISNQTDADDPLFTLGGLADAQAQSLTNQQIDRVLHGH